MRNNGQYLQFRHIADMFHNDQEYSFTPTAKADTGPHFVNRLFKNEDETGCSSAE